MAELNRILKPKFVSISTYKEVVEEVVEKLKSHMGAIDSVYLAGGDWTPGISDVDIVVFAKDDQLHRLYNYGILLPSYLEHPEASYLVRHPYGIYPVSVKEGAHFIGAYTSEWRLLLGEPFRFPRYTDFSSNEGRGLMAAQIFGLLYKKLFRFITLDWRVDPLQYLGWLWSLTYTIDCINFIQPSLNQSSYESFEDYKDKIKRLKTGFFDLSTTQKENSFRDLANIALKIVFTEIPAAISSFLSEFGLCLRGTYDLIMPDIKIHFRENPKVRFGHIRYWKVNAIWVETWLNLLFFLAKLSEFSSFFHLRINKEKLQGDIILDGEIESGIITYCYWLNRLAEVNRNIKIPHPYSRRFFLNKGIKNRIANIYRCSVISAMGKKHVHASPMVPQDK